MTDDELKLALREHAYLEGDFLLRSGKRSRYYLDKYRFETRPDLLGELGRRIADAVREHEPDATLLASPELGARHASTSDSRAPGERRRRPSRQKPARPESGIASDAAHARAARSASRPSASSRSDSGDPSGSETIEPSS